VTLPAKLTFAVLYDDGIIRPHPPILRGLKQTVASLRAAGHEVVDFPHDVALWQEGQDLLDAAYYSDGGDHIRDVIEASGEPWIPGLQPVQSARPGLSSREMWALHMKKDSWQVRFARQWNSTSKLTKSGKPIDALICPATPYASAKRYGFDWAGYTSTFNLAGTCDRLL
jgi:amidase